MMQLVRFYLEKNRQLQIKTVFMLNDDLSDLQGLATAFVSKEILMISGPFKSLCYCCCCYHCYYLVVGQGRTDYILAMFHILEGL